MRAGANCKPPVGTDLEPNMQTIFSFVRADAVAGLGAAGLNLIVASALVTLSLMLCVAVSLLAGLPALVRQPQRAINSLRRRR